MLTISAHIENNQIIPDEKIDLPDGLKVKILLPAPQSSGLCGIWEDDRTAEEMIQDILTSRTAGRTHEILD